jgi:hypothetical protein
MRKALFCLCVVAILEYIAYGTSWGWLTIPLIMFATAVSMGYIALYKKISNKMFRKIK